MVTFQILDLEQIIIQTKKETDFKFTNHIKLEHQVPNGKQFW